MSDEGLDRRSFLKSAAAISTSIAAAKPSPAVANIPLLNFEQKR